jgi:hypothetical protein
MSILATRVPHPPFIPAQPGLEGCDLPPWVPAFAGTNGSA